MTDSDARLLLHGWLLDQFGKPYTWDSKGPESFDCSGLVTCGMKRVGLPDWTLTHGTARLWAELEATDEPMPMDLCFFGLVQGGQLTNGHVMTLWDDGRVYGACGGNSHVTSVELAKKANAYVKFQLGTHYRHDFIGYRHLPIP